MFAINVAISQTGDLAHEQWKISENQDELPIIEQKIPCLPWINKQFGLFPIAQLDHFSTPQARMAGRPGLVQSAAAIFDVRLQAGRSGPWVQHPGGD